MGRKRKIGRRTKSGQLSRAKDSLTPRGERGIMEVALAQPHRRNLPKDKRRDQRAATALGRLNLFGLIPDHEYQAGEQWKALHGDFLRVMAAPMSRVSAAALYVSERVEAAPEAGFLPSEIPETEEERTSRIVEAFNKAQSRLRLCDNPRDAASALQAVVIEDLAPADFAHLRAALAMLARLWKIEPRHEPRPAPRPKAMVTVTVSSRPARAYPVSTEVTYDERLAKSG